MPDNNYKQNKLCINFGKEDYDAKFNQHFSFNNPKYNFSFKTNLSPSRDDIIKNILMLILFILLLLRKA